MDRPHAPEVQVGRVDRGTVDVVDSMVDVGWAATFVCWPGRPVGARLFYCGQELMTVGAHTRRW